MIDNAQVLALFENIAATHPKVAHDPVNAIRFSGFNPDALDEENRSQLNWEKLVIAMAEPDKTSLAWRYNTQGTSNMKLKDFDVLIIGTAGRDQDDATEEQICSEAESVVDDIEKWLLRWNGHPAWPIIDLIIMENLTARRIYNVGIAECCGVAIRFQLNANVPLNNDNPLNAMTP